MVVSYTMLLRLGVGGPVLLQGGGAVNPDCCEIYLNLNSQGLEIQIGNPGLERLHQLREKWLLVSRHSTESNTDRCPSRCNHLSAVRADEISRNLMISRACTSLASFVAL